MKIASLSDKGSIERSENRAFIRALVGEAGYFHLKVRAMWNPGYILRQVNCVHFEITSSRDKSTQGGEYWQLFGTFQPHS